MRYFDAHSHLYAEQFDIDREETLARMQESETGTISIGVDLETSKKSVQLAEEHEFIWASIGLHPRDNMEEVVDPEAYAELAKHPKVVAIGECGLDYFNPEGGEVDEDTKKDQKKRFSFQIELAANTKKPLIVHCRDAHEDMLEMLTEAKATHGENLTIIIHFCTVSGELAEKYLALGAYLSFPGPITFTDMYDESVRICPPDRFLTETDSPYAAPKQHRGRRNEPIYVAEVVGKIAQLWGMEEAEVAERSAANAKAVFGL